jgi:hypothetical protein
MANDIGAKMATTTKNALKPIVRALRAFHPYRAS